MYGDSLSSICGLAWFYNPRAVRNSLKELIDSLLVLNMKSLWYQITDIFLKELGIVFDVEKQSFFIADCWWIFYMIVESNMGRLKILKVFILNIIVCVDD